MYIVFYYFDKQLRVEPDLRISSGNNKLKFRKFQVDKFKILKKIYKFFEILVTSYYVLLDQKLVIDSYTDAFDLEAIPQMREGYLLDRICTYDR